MRSSASMFAGVCALALVAAVAASGVQAAQSQAAQPQARPAAARPGPTAQATVARAAEALGGAAKIRAVKNITLLGYGQYVYMNGEGRIDGSPEAPEKYIAANEMRRVYDLEHGRYQERERRNNLFPFLLPNGHSFAQQDRILDGDIAFNPAPDGARRAARLTDGDGVHYRRMMMLTNPVVLVRTLMDGGARMSAPRREGAWTVIDVTLKEGDKLAAGFRADGLPAFIRWSNPQTNLGQNNFTTWFSGWSDAGGGVMLPLGYQTRLDWRNIDFAKVYVDAYRLDTQIADLAAPAAVRAAPEPAAQAPRLTSVSAGKGIWRISNGTTVVEFKDHLVIYELGVNVNQAKAVLAYARSLAPGKPIKYLIASHNHFDHTAGLRQAVAEGVTVIQRPASEAQFREVTSRPAPDYPDDLARNPKPLKFMPVKEHLRLQDETQTLDVYWGRTNGHMADTVFAYAPAQKVMMEGDLVSAAYDWQHWPDTFRDAIAYYKLDVEKISPVHSVWPEHPDILTHDQAEELLSGGTKRAREHCAAELAKGNYFPGCPIQSKYY